MLNSTIWVVRGAMGNGMNKIVPGLFVGSCRDAKDEQQLKENSITHVVSLHSSAKEHYNYLKYKCLDVDDSPTQDLSKYFQDCTNFIHQARLSGGTVLVHCIAGVSRAVTITCAYLMSVTHFGWPEILEAVRCARPQAGPNFGFQNQLMKFYQNGVARSERERLKTLYPDSKFDDDDAHLQKLLQEKQATTDPID